MEVITLHQICNHPRICCSGSASEALIWQHNHLQRNYPGLHNIYGHIYMIANSNVMIIIMDKTSLIPWRRSDPLSWVVLQRYSLGYEHVIQYCQVQVHQTEARRACITKPPTSQHTSTSLLTPTPQSGSLSLDDDICTMVILWRPSYT